MKNLRWKLLGALMKPVRRARQIRNLIRWTSPSATAKASGDPPRRVLAIYDLTTQPFSIGDILVIQQASLVIRENCGAELVDFALVYDPKTPTCRDPQFAGITEENLLFHLASVLPVAQVNQHLGSLFVFNSHAQLLRHIEANSDRYCVWPSLAELARETFLYYPVLNELLYTHFEKHGSIPHLGCRDHLVEWAHAFYRERVLPDVAVSVQLRNNKRISLSRNSQMEAWLELFAYCADRFPVKFVVVCALSEVDDRLRGLRNVILAKEHGTNIEQDLAFIHTAAFHMGASSGPGTIALFGEKPFLKTNTDLIPEVYRGLVQENGLYRFFFSSPLQAYSPVPETAEFLVEQFERLWATVNVEEWNAEVSRSAADRQMQSWLR